MYERKIPVDLDCPLRLTMSLIDSKWKSCILDELRHRALRPSELHKIFPEATPRVLDLQLKELVEDGLVSKTIYPELASSFGVCYHSVGDDAYSHHRCYDCMGREEYRII